MKDANFGFNKMEIDRTWKEVKHVRSIKDQWQCLADAEWANRN